MEDDLILNFSFFEFLNLKFKLFQFQIQHRIGF